MSNSTDLSYIKNLQDLQAMQVMVKLRVKEREKDLAERLHKLPHEAIKSTVGAVLPSFISKRVTGASFSILTSAVKLLFSRKSKKDGIKDDMLSSAKKLGLFSLLRSAYNLWAKK